MSKIFIIAFDLCSQNGLVKAFQIIGYALAFLKTVIPILIICMGSYEFGKAALSNDDKAIKTAANSLIKKTIAGVVIFFIPTIIAFITSLIDDANKLNNFDCLTKCIKTPSKCPVPKTSGGLFTR